LRVRMLTVVLAGFLALACLVLVGRNASTQLDFWFICGASIAGAGIALFIASLGIYAKAQPAARMRSPAIKLLHLCGDASLSIYLWHTFFIDLALLATWRWGLAQTAKVALLLATVPVVIVTSIITYRAIEAPMIALSKSPAWRSRVRHLVARASEMLSVTPNRAGKQKETD